MIKHGTVLLLGAGASVAYGYPTGGELREQIILNGESILPAIDSRYGPRARKFSEDFRDSALYSIDSFLEKRKELAVEGKLCRAEILLKCEERYTHAKEPAQDWYADLWNRLCTPEFEALDLSQLSVVTFNYDRSLEHYLLRAIMATYGVARQLALEKLRAFRIIHVYGSLGDAFDFQSNYMPRVRELEPHHVRTAAAQLLTIPDDRNGSNDRFEACAQLLLDAERLCILGFGFDETNMKRLGAPKSLGPHIYDPDRRRLRSRDVFATGHGLTEAQREEVMRKCGFPPIGGSLYDQNTKHAVLPATCRELIHATLALGW